MKNSLRLPSLMAATAFLFLFACEKEILNNGDSSPQIAADVNSCGPEHQNPGACRIENYDLLDGTGASGATISGVFRDYGSASISHNPTNGYISVFAGSGWFINSISAYWGTQAGIPVSGSNMDVAAFSEQGTYNPAGACAGVVVPIQVDNCYAVVANVGMNRVDFLGNPTNFVTVWGAGNSYLNGYVMDYCTNGCSPEVEISGCSMVLVGAPGRNCTTLSANVSGGSAPFSYQWSDGSTSASITVCPTATTTYSVTVTDQNNNTGTASFTVTATDITCGNGKVLICRTSGNAGTQCVSLNHAQNMVNGGNAYWGPCELNDPCR